MLSAILICLLYEITVRIREDTEMFSDKLVHVPESSGNYQLNGDGYFCLKP